MENPIERMFFADRRWPYQIRVMTRHLVEKDAKRDALYKWACDQFDAQNYHKTWFRYGLSSKYVHYCFKNELDSFTFAAFAEGIVNDPDRT